MNTVISRPNWFVTAPLALLLACCTTPRTPPLSAELDETAFRSHVRILASDEFEGRKPGTLGEEKTVAYLVAQYQKIGLKPGNGKSYVQPVPLVETVALGTPELRVEGPGGSLNLAYGTDMVIWTKHVQELAALERSEMVFVGYGIVAPEYRWDDYANIDVRGKTVVVLVNDPGYATKDPQLFLGEKMTYYGRWTYKFEEAARHGAAGVLIVHETGAAGYGWNVVASSWMGPQQDRVTADGNAGRPSIEGWLSNAGARAVFQRAGLAFDTLQMNAARRGFRAVPMGLSAHAVVRNSIRTINSQNVIGILPGSGRAREYILYSAHWDHFGKSGEPGAEKIFHGAMDNATGVAGMLTLAQSFSRTRPANERTLVFLAVTGEESGLLGSAYYVENPIYPLKDTVADINLDVLHVGGPTRDVMIVGMGNSELEDYLREAALLQGREVREESRPEQGHFFRSDQFNFAKHGVPALYATAGVDDTERGPVWGQQQRDAYTSQRYHRPEDVYSENWDLRGTMQDLRLYLSIGLRLAHERRFPNWYPGSAFGAGREKRPGTRN